MNSENDHPADVRQRVSSGWVSVSAFTIFNQ